MTTPPPTAAAMLQAALAGDPQAQFAYAMHLQALPEAAEPEPEPEPEAASAAEVLKEVKVIQTKARSRKRAAVRAKRAGQLVPVELEEGNPEQKDPAFWMRMAHENGHDSAGVALANRLFNEGSPQGVAEAIELYEQAAAAGHADACFNLGNAFFEGSPEAGLLPDLARSLRYFTQGADAGDACCQYWMGHCFASGEGGVPQKDLQRGVEYLRRAAEQQHPAALYYLSIIHRDMGGDENMARFRDGLQRAFDAGSADAAFCLAEVYMNGSDGFPVDLLRSREMLVEAVDRGHAEAAMSLGAVFFKGSLGAPRDREKAFQLYNLAAERGCEDAWKNIAAMYATGEGVEKSEETAKYIMRVVFGGGKEGKKAGDGGGSAAKS